MCISTFRLNPASLYLLLADKVHFASAGAQGATLRSFAREYPIAAATDVVGSGI